MKKCINILSKSVYCKIAAGEIIYDTSSILKELIENSIDANSNIIKIIIKDYGKTLIQIIDNGNGMCYDDALICFKRYTTSKILYFSDLLKITTLGFRGEGLFAISSIADITLKTSQSNNIKGISLFIKNGNLLKKEFCYCSKGTSIAVENIFFNMPARRKSLSNNKTEFNKILEVYKIFAISNPKINFYFYHQDKLISFFKQENYINRINNVLKDKYVSKLIFFNDKQNDFYVKGCISKPNFKLKKNLNTYLFVNNRFCKNKKIHNLISKLYKSFLYNKNFIYIIFIFTDSINIDFNINPDKSKIEFHNNEIITKLIHNIIQKNIGQYSWTLDSNFELNNFFEKKNSYKITIDNQDIISSNYNYAIIDQLKKFVKNNKNEIKSYQLYNKYIIINFGQNMIFINQKLAHQKILYDQYIYNIHNNNIKSNNIFLPFIYTINYFVYKLFNKYKYILNNIGFFYDLRNENQISIKKLPNDIFYINNLDSFVKKLIAFFDKKSLQYDIIKAESIIENISIDDDYILNNFQRNYIIKKLLLSKDSIIGINSTLVINILKLTTIENILQIK
ncbi:MAG: DNA mismatch repair endonuclease MutL [Bacteroides sp.]|nr:MAG: DNA mismatch repair endonuclease MutL [Bacteroides sp.]